jgi:tetratricopeptide (TPR) repeat protein
MHGWTLVFCVVGMVVGGALSATRRLPAATGTNSLSLAQEAFYNARYEEAAAHAVESLAATPDDLPAYELRTTALLFQVKRLLGDDKKRHKNPQEPRKAPPACELCPDLVAAFLSDISAAQGLARNRLRAAPEDEMALYFLGKINLNYVWLHLGPLGRKAGLSEYWEARRSLDGVLRRNPAHVRARVARAWVDYIVGTRMPRGTKWLVGGGNRQRALGTMREAATANADFYTSAEARFALWEMLVREQDFDAALDVARGLMLDFPSNRDLANFVEARGVSSGVGSKLGVYIWLDGVQLDRYGFWLPPSRGSRAAQTDS